MRSGRGASWYSSSRRRYLSASTPSGTTVSLEVSRLAFNASSAIMTSPGSSSTSSTLRGPRCCSVTWFGTQAAFREGEPKGRTVVGFYVSEPDAPAVEFDDLAAQREPDAGAAVLVPQVQPLEHDEDPLGVLVVDPDAVVLDDDRPVVGIVALGPDPDNGRDVLAAILHRVADQILEQRRQERAVARHERQLGEPFDVRPRRAEHVGEGVERLVERVVQVDGNELFSRPADARQGEQVRDEPLHALGAVDREVDVLAGPVVELRSVLALQ